MRLPSTLLVAALVVAASGCAGSTSPESATGGPGGTTVASDAPGPPATEGSVQPSAPSQPTPSDASEADDDLAGISSPPRRIEIPTIGVEAEIIDLGLHDDGSLETPVDFAQTGWWAGGATADERGPTVIVGHVDSFVGPAVFFRLSELEAGDHIVVSDAHGASHRFRVTEIGLYDKDNFPTDRVYGPTDEPTLRLVTCGGDFDEGARSYEANWVVFATPV